MDISDQPEVIPRVALYRAWRAAGQPVELHIYAQGGHGFGMRKQGLPADHWIDRFGEWLQVQVVNSANVRRFLRRNLGNRRECWESSINCLNIWL